MLTKRKNGIITKTGLLSALVVLSTVAVLTTLVMASEGGAVTLAHALMTQRPPIGPGPGHDPVPIPMPCNLAIRCSH
jgi:hypothetical protein